MRSHTKKPTRSVGWGGVARGLLAVATASGFLVLATFAPAKDEKKNAKLAKKPGQAAQSNLPPLKTADEKLAFLEKIHKSFPAKRVGGDVVFTSETLDTELRVRINASAGEYAPVIDDEGFVRRVYLDLTGKVPDAATVHDFVKNDDAKKRAKLIDELLETKDYSQHWGHYWRNVIMYNAPAKGKQVNGKALEDWFAGEFAKNVGWDRIVSEMISATPKRGKKNADNEYGQNYGPNNFVLAYENKAGEIASQTARLFMGISIQCAECHDHPFDKWKREQFHEMAAFFSSGKYYMPDQDDPSKKTEVKAQFLLGEKPPANLKPDALRVAVAAYLVYNPDNYWFARAYVNRIWSELIGDGFYSVDSLGPDKECNYPLVINRLAAVFRYKDFNVKWVFRTIMNSQTYQRQSRTPDSQQKLFTAVRPSRMRPDQVVNAVQNVTGDLPGGVRNAVSRTFNVDPSAPQGMLEGSMQQALLLMNNPQLQKALANSKLKSELTKIKADDELLDFLYLSTLARHATDREVSRGKDYLKQVSNRSDAIDDLLWAVLNSTEFLTKR